MGIVSYGVSITTLEEVFLKINQEFKINIGNAAAEDRKLEQTGQQEIEADVTDEPQEGKKSTMEKSRESLNESGRDD